MVEQFGTAPTLADVAAANYRAKELERQIAELRAILARAVPTINAVERLRDIRSAGYPREDEENRLCETIETFCGDVGNALEHDHG